MKSFVKNIKGEVYRPSKERDLELDTVHKGLIMPNISIVNDLFIQASFLFLRLQFFDFAVAVDCVDL